MSKTFEFLFDVGAPNAYLVHKILPEFCARHDAKAIYKPVLLGGIFKATGNRAPLIRYADAPAKLAYEQLEFKRFLEAHSVAEFRFNPHFPVNSLLAMRVIAGAQDSADLSTVIDTMMRGMWEDGIDLGQAETVIDALDDAGLNGKALVAHTDDPDVKARLAAQTGDAVARGVFGVPTFFVGDEMFWGKERLGQVADALA
jgi:2-hydroxychromene-2-carboxylate isomerase